MIQVGVSDEKGVDQMLGNVRGVGSSCSTLQLQAFKGSINQCDWPATTLYVIGLVTFQDFDDCPKMDTCVDGQ